ncbi:MAG TPA: UbiA prenyltransferase family protein [Streptosporangiaceae bacterium]|nr:UbiA prenyltransferase family protein [Streptosporangiaceae bacterium]
MHTIESTGSPGTARLGWRPAAPAARRPRLIRDVVALARPLHAAKSLLLVPVALAVDPHSWSVAALARVGWAVVAFVLASACIYVGNDIADRRRDMLHPAKRHRPIAAGRIPVAGGYLYCAALAGAVGWLAVAAPGGPYWPVLVYVVLNVAYSRVLKHIALIDVCVVALGFVLRVVQGYVAARTPVSGWLIVAVFSVSLSLVIGKRRQELLQNGPAHRPALRGYSVELANQLLLITCVLSLVAGLIYLRTEAPFGHDGQAAMLVSTPFALFALFRYLKMLYVDRCGSDPVRVLLGDRTMVGTCVLWAAALGATLAFASFGGIHHPVLP